MKIKEPLVRKFDEYPNIDIFYYLFFNDIILIDSKLVKIRPR